MHLLALFAIALAAPPQEAGATPSEPTPTSFEVEVDKTTLTTDEDVTLTVTIVGKYHHLDEPTFKDFKLLSRRRVDRFMDRGGQKVRTRQFIYELEPKLIGRLTIPEFELRNVDELIAQSAPVDLQVDQATKPEAVSLAALRAPLPTGALAVRVKVPEGTLFVGAPTPIVWEVLAPAAMRVESSRFVRVPSFAGFVAHDPSDPPAQSAEAPQGMRVVARAVKVVIPLTAGELRVDDVKVKVWEGDSFEVTSHTVRAPAFLMPVAAHPEGAPVGWSSHNVGSFEAATRLVDAEGRPTSSAKTGEPLTLIVELSGEGKLTQANVPIPLGKREFAVTRALGEPEDEAIEVDERGMRGKKAIRFRLQALQPGKLTTPPVHFAWLDPKDGQYHKLTIPGHALAVSGDAVHSERPPVGFTPLLGGRTLGDRAEYAIRVKAGWPGVVATYVLGVADDLDISPQLGIVYGRGTDTGLLGFEPGVEIKWQILADGALSLALLAEPAIVGWIPTAEGAGGLFGVRFGLPGIVLGYRATSGVNLATGLRVRPTLVFGDDTQFIVPILADFRTELLVAETEDAAVSLNTLLSAGPELCTGNCREATFSLELGIGVTVAW